MAEATIVDVHKIPAIAPERKGRDDVLVKYDLGNGQRRYLRLPAETATQQSIQDAIKKDLADLKSLVGKTVSH